jgi:hypothetical protein
MQVVARAHVDRCVARTYACFISNCPATFNAPEGAGRFQHASSGQLSMYLAGGNAEVCMAKYGKSASKNVESAMRRRKRGTLKSGKGGKGGGKPKAKAQDAADAE